MDRIWLAAPVAAMRLWTEAGRQGWRVNTAARAWGLRSGAVPGSWSRIAERMFALTAAGGTTGLLEAFALRWEAIPMPLGVLVWLTPADALPTTWGTPQERLALVQEFGAIGLFERNMQTLEARWDDLVYELFGLDPRQGPPPYGAVLLQVHPQDRQDFAAEHARLIREGGRHGLRFRVLAGDGSVRTLQVMAEMHRDAQGAPLKLIGAVADDADGDRRLRHHQAINAHLRQALELAKVSVWRIDEASRRIYFNDIGYRLIGLEPRAEGLDIEELRSLAHPEDQPALLRAAAIAASGHEVVDVEVRYAGKGEHVYHLMTRRVAERDQNGRVTGMLGISLDQTPAILARHRAQSLARRIAMVTEAAALGIWSIDLVSGQVEWNEEMFRIYGVGPGEQPDDAVAWMADFVHPDHHEALRALQLREQSASGSGFELEFRIIRPDGEMRWVVSRSRYEREEGRASLVGIHLDVTELIEQRERAESAVREKEAALQASHAKTAFLARVSHELRTPLNAVLGFAQLIEHDGANAPMQVVLDRAAQIRVAGQHLLALVDDVLDLAAIEADDASVAMESVDLDAVLREVVQWHAPQASRDGVKVRVASGAGHVRGEARRLRRLVSNLLSNALKFNRPGGNVWLSGGAGGASSPRGWFVSVRDDGRGIEVVQQKQLFEAFDRLGAEREGIPGVGLGLAIVKHLAERMNGLVSVESEPGHGSEFRVWLEAAPPIAMAATQAPEVGAELPLTLLYIEDNPVNVILIQELVAMRPNLRLEVAEDGESGVAKALSLRPEIVLIDMHLPDFDGFEVLRRLRARPELEGQVRIALSANSLGQDISQARAAGFHDYWTKPIDFGHFFGALDELESRLRARRSVARIDGDRVADQGASRSLVQSLPSSR